LLENDLTEESPLLLSRDKLRKLTLFDVDNYFLQGDEKLTDAFQKICTDEEVENKRCITCDETHDFYSVAARKLIHLFIYQNDLFQNINLRSECLLDEQIDVTKLRRNVELLLRQEVGQWEITPKEKNKFILCTICHLIRHFRLLGQLDKMDSINSFFKFRVEIFNLSKVELASEQTQVMNELGLGKPQVIGKEQPKEVVVTQLPMQEEQTNDVIIFDENKLELLKSQLETLAKKLDLASLTPIEIIEYERKAKELLNPEGVEETSEPDLLWVDVFLEHSQDRGFQPFLAKEALIRLEKEMTKEQLLKNNKHKENSSFISDEELEQNKLQCSNCRETIDFAICLERVEKVTKAITHGTKAIRKLWDEQVELRPCIANRLRETTFD